MLHPYCFSRLEVMVYQSVKSSRDAGCNMYLIIPTVYLVRILLCTAIPTSPVNFIQLFFMLVSVFFVTLVG